MSVYVIEEGSGGYAIRNTRTLAVVAFQPTFSNATKVAARLNQAAERIAKRISKTPHSAPCCDCAERAETLARVAEHFRAYVATLAINGVEGAERAIEEAIKMTGGGHAD